MAPRHQNLGIQFPSDTGSDMLVHEWTLHWLKQALLNLQNPFFTHLLAHPTGVSLTSHNIAWVNFGLWLPLSYAWGQAAATSLTYLLIFTFNAYAMYLFAYDQTRSLGRRLDWGSDLWLLSHDPVRWRPHQHAARSAGCPWRCSISTA